MMQNNIYAQNSAENNIPEPKVISFNPESAQYQCLLDGKKDSVVFYSGFVTLTPNTKGELHSTEEYEEMIIVLEGKGKLNITNHKSLEVTFGKVAFVPPDTEHQMENTGMENFKYIYVATKSK